jgi:hypothetical protein
LTFGQQKAKEVRKAAADGDGGDPGGAAGGPKL